MYFSKDADSVPPPSNHLGSTGAGPRHFLTCIQISQEAGQVVWYSHHSQNFPQFIVMHAVKGFGIVNKAEVDIFLELFAFSVTQWMLAI